jgi:hypothetical protein
MRRIWITTFSALLIGCCACTPAQSPAPQSVGAAAADLPSGDVFLLKHGVWPEFERYRAQLKPEKDEYFATAPDGAWAWENTEQKALDLCQEHSTGPKCIPFAHNAKILVPYRLN